MKKICLITLHRVKNYGSVLQTYATQYVLEKMGYEVEIVDYYPSRYTFIGMLKRIKNQNSLLKKNVLIRLAARMIIIPSYVLRFKTFNKFIHKYLNLSQQTYKTFEDLTENVPNAEIYITGSDQVWNSEWNGGIDKPLFLGFVPDNKRKIAYAASFGMKELPKNEIKDIKALLQRYNNISLREKSGVDILKSMGIKNAVNVVDPTLLLSGDEWRKLSSNKYNNKKYILVYNLNRNKNIDSYAKNLSQKTGLKIIYLSYQLHEFYKEGKMVCNPKVEDFISLIDNASYVISDSFHATAFSINFNKEFIIVYPDKYSNRLQNILGILKLENRVAKDANDMKVVNNLINYKEVNRKLQSIREESLDWLKNSME